MRLGDRASQSRLQEGTFLGDAPMASFSSCPAATHRPSDASVEAGDSRATKGRLMGDSVRVASGEAIDVSRGNTILPSEQRRVLVRRTQTTQNMPPTSRRQKRRHPLASMVQRENTPNTSDEPRSVSINTKRFSLFLASHSNHIITPVSSTPAAHRKTRMASVVCPPEASSSAALSIHPAAPTVPQQTLTMATLSYSARHSSWLDCPTGIRRLSAQAR